MPQKENWEFAQEAMQYDWLQYQQSSINYPKKWDKLEEPFAERILQNTLKEYKIIQNDTGLVSSMCDFIAEKNGHRIAIEVTQHTDRRTLENLSFLKNKNGFQEEGLCYDWILTTLRGADISKKGREKLVQLLRELEIQYPIDEINSCKLGTNIPPQVKFLIEAGFNYFYGKRSSNKSGSYKITCIMDPATPDLLEVFKIVHAESVKDDNVKKLSAVTVDERHLFIPITGFSSSAASYIQSMPNGKQVLTKQEVMARLNLTAFIPDNIDIVWIATLRNFEEIEGRIGYRLATITNQKTRFTFEPITDGIALY